MAKLCVHIGHHFFGAGNLGDDLMLAGFLAAAGPAWLGNVELTCCSPHDLASQRRRFPEVRWLPYDAATREARVAGADVWLGLGDTPFQVTGGHFWFLEHLGEEAAWCRRHGTPMYYLGVGVNERAAAEHPQTRVLVAQAEHIWTRDESSAEMLAPLAVPGVVTAHADLAHLALAGAGFPTPQPGTLGLVLNFEDPMQYRFEWLAELVRLASNRWNTRWLAQEVRPLSGSETFLYARLPADARGQTLLKLPAYGHAESALELLAEWRGTASLLVSRYHAALIGAWMGAAVTVFARNDKVAGAARQLALPTVASLEDTATVLEAVAAAQPVARGLLLDLAARAHEACTSFFRMAGSYVPSLNFSDNFPSSRHQGADHLPPPPRRLLLLRPDTYGDLVLFEPALRLIQRAWPQTEIAVLIRARAADIVPVLDPEGNVRWLTTDCDPYRQAPGDCRIGLEELAQTVRSFAPDCVVAACAPQTWLEPAVAALLPGTRQVTLGVGLDDPTTRVALGAILSVDWAAIYPEKVPVEPTEHEWEKTLRLVRALTGDAAEWWPVARVPEAGHRAAEHILAGAGLSAGGFVACAAAGIANVSIKAWPAENFGEILGWLETKHDVRALLIGHVAERDRLEAVQQAARVHGGDPALWTGRDGEMPIVAGLLEAARFYFGNDTGTLHLAAALGRPVVSIFGGGHWPRFRPVAAREMTVVQPLPCFGCAWECDFNDAPCVQTISVESVRRALEDFLAADGPARAVAEVHDLDANARALIDAAAPRLRFLREDGRARLRQVKELSALLTASETDRAARLEQVEELTAMFKASETDRAARLEQVEELTALLAVSEADRAARLKNVEELSTLLTATENDRAARLKNMEELETLLAASETDRAARLVNIEALTALIHAATSPDEGVLDGKG